MLGPAELAGLLDRLEVRPVLTAHPTEARRRAVTEALRRISAQLDSFDNAQLGAAAHEEARRRLREEIDLLWRTSALRVQGMQPLDEVRSGAAVFDETLFRLAPTVYRALDQALQADASGRAAPLAPAFLRFGSWIGGDRDGNPFVTAAVTEQTARIHADHALRALERATTRIGRVHDTACGTAGRAGGRTAKRRSPPRPARTRLWWARSARIRPGSRSGPSCSTSCGGCERPGLSEPVLARATAAIRFRRMLPRPISLTTSGWPSRAWWRPASPRQAYGELQHLIWQAETFGFHWAELEVRQHSAVHAAALLELRSGREPSARTQEVLATMAAMAGIQRLHGIDACRRYIVSFTTSADDIAAVHELAELANPAQPPVLDVIPLFESAGDLANSVSIMEGMIALEPVARRMAATGRRLEVMLGYSDSAKELGTVGASLRLFDAQLRLACWASERDIRLTLFHGRGGALGRGGGPAGRAVLAQAPGSVGGRFKVTEQGEVIFARYGHPAIAQRHVEQVTSAVLLASVGISGLPGQDR